MSGAIKLAGSDRLIRCMYVASGLGATGLTVTVDVWRYRSGSWSEIASGASCTEIGDGHYYYTITSANIQAGDLFDYTFKTSGTADQKHLPGILDIQETGLFTTIAAAVWDALTSGITTASSIGKQIVDNLNATVSSRSTLTAAGVWDYLSSAASTAGSLGKRMVDYLTGDIYARLGAPAGASTAADIAAVSTKLGTPAGASVSADVAAIKAQTDGIADIPTNAELATALDPIATAAKVTAATSPLATTADLALVYNRIGAPVGASVSADIAAVKADTAGIADVPTNTELATALDPLPTLTELQDELAGVDSAVRADISSLSAKIGAPAGASVSADIAAIKAQTDGIADVPTTAELAATEAAIIADTGATETVVLAAIDAIPTNSELAVAIDALPTAAENAAALLSTGGLGAFAADTVGQRLADMSAAGVAEEILAKPVPGNNTAGTVGAALGKIDGYNLEVRSTVLDDENVEIIIGDDLHASLQNSIDWPLAGLPDLTGYTALIMTVKISSEDGANPISVVFSSGSVLNAGQATQTLRIEATATETAELLPGDWPFDVQVANAAGKKRTMVRGTVHARENYSA